MGYDCMDGQMDQWMDGGMAGGVNGLINTWLQGAGVRLWVLPGILQLSLNVHSTCLEVKQLL